MIGPTTGRLARSPDSRSLLWTVWPKIRTFARRGVLLAVSSAVIIRFRRWIWSKWLSWRCEVTRVLPFVLTVSLDTLRWSATAWWVIWSWTIPTARLRSFWQSRGIDVLVKIFSMANCLLLLTAQLMILGDLNA